MPLRLLDRPLERRFDRFRRTGDPAALAAVFDATAAEILRVAHHLTRDAAAAEDLLQRTFLSAIEAAATWDRTRRLMPWLLGILGNHAKEAARRDARVVDPERRPVAEPTSPATAAADREALSNVGRALDALPDPVRSVLVLRYRHGLEPAEIALALGMAPSTVRSHLRRGVERVRRVVPGALAGVALGARPLRGLDAVRATVLGRAAAAGPGLVAATAALRTVGPSLVGGIVMAKSAIVAATGLLLLVGGSLWVVTRDADDGTATQRPPAAPTADAAQAAHRVAPGLASSAGRVARPTSATAVGPADRPPTTGALDVEVVTSAGRPLAGEPVIVERDGVREALGGRVVARTGADGRTRVGGLAAGRVVVRSGRGGGARADVPAGGVGSVRVALARGVTIEGAVVDADGARVPAAGIWVEAGGPRGLACVEIVTTDADGRFHLDDVAADASVSARRRGRVPSGARRVAGQPGQLDRMTLVIGGPGAAVRGTVVDVDGRPVAGAVVFVGDVFPPPMNLPDGGHGTGPVGAAAWTDVDGRFELDPLVPAKTSVTVRAAGHAPHRGAATLVPGLNTVAVTLGRPYAIEGRIVTAAGAPAAGATVRSSDAHDVMWSWAAVADSDGRFRLDELPSESPGGWSLDLEIRHASGQLELPVRAPWPQGETYRLSAPARIRVRVEDESGRPLAGREVFAGVDGTPVGTTGATTDAEGRATLEVGMQATYTVGLAARDRDPHAPTVERAGIRPGPAEVVLVERAPDRASARVTARVVAVERLPDGAFAWAMRAGALSGVNLTLDPATGVLTGPPLAPGRYELAMSAVGYGNVPLGVVRLDADATLDLGDVRLVRPGRLVVHLRGTPGLLRSGGGIQAVGPRGTVWARPAADGTATFDLLQPGPWDVVVPGWPYEPPAVAATSVRVDVTSGATTTIAVEPPRGHVRTLRPTGREPAALRGLAVDVHAEESAVPLARFAAGGTADGPRTLDVALAPGRYVADAETADGRRVSVPFEVRGDGEPPVELALPR